MADIAAAAGVAVQTVYFLFRNKTGVLQALWQGAVLGDERLPPPQQSWFREASEEPDLRKALHLIVAGGIAIAARLAPLAAALEALPATADLEEFRSHDVALRQSGFRLTVEMLVAKGGLRDGMGLDEAADIMLMLLSPDAYRYLVLGRGWSVDRFESWVVEAMISTVFNAS